MKGKHLTQYEKEYIRDNHQRLSDERIAKVLGRYVATITNERRRKGYRKGPGRTKNIDVPSEMEQLMEKSPVDLEDEERQRLLKQRFEATKRHNRLVDILTDPELDFYTTKYMEFLHSVETLTPTEEDSLHLMIMELIIQQQLFKKKKEGDGDSKDFNWFEKAYHDSVDRFGKLQRALKASREQRLKDRSESKVNISTIVQGFRDKESRKRIGENAALIEAARDVWKKQNSEHILGEI